MLLDEQVATREIQSFRHTVEPDGVVVLEVCPDEHSTGRIAACACGECETRPMSNESAVQALGTCQVCANGELVFSFVPSDQRLIIECLECLTGYVEPTDLAASDVVRMEQTESRFATAQGVEHAGMAHLLAP